MSLGILGQKLGMTRIFNEAGQSVPVTVVAAGPCPVVEVRTPEKNGYSAVLLGFGERKAHKVTKPMKGQFERAGVAPCRWLREFRIDNAADYKVGSTIDVTVFAEGGDGTQVSDDACVLRDVRAAAAGADLDGLLDDVAAVLALRVGDVEGVVGCAVLDGEVDELEVLFLREVVLQVAVEGAAAVGVLIRLASVEDELVEHACVVVCIVEV